MADIIVVENEEPSSDENSQTIADPAFVHGEAVGEFRSHMESCSRLHAEKDSRLAAIASEVESLRRSADSASAAAESAAASAETAAVAAIVTAVDNAGEPDPAIATEGGDVIAMEMPEVPTGVPEEDATPSRGRDKFSLW